MNAVIAEDNLTFRRTLVELLEQWGIETDCCVENGEELLSYLRDYSADLAFLDVSLPNISGLEIARYIRKQHPWCEIIFITAHDQYIKEAVGLYAADYIVKPLNHKRLEQTVRRLQRKSMYRPDILEVKAGRDIHYLIERDIYFVEAWRNKVIIHMPQRQIEVSHSLKEIQEMVGTGFFRCSRSYLVNLSQVKAIKAYSRTSYALLFAGGGRAILSKRLYGDFKSQIKSIAY